LIFFFRQYCITVLVLGDFFFYSLMTAKNKFNNSFWK
jgi:hypothetical protein